MRKLVLTLFVLACAVPAAGSAAPARGVGDGTLSVDDGEGRIVIVAKGAVIGRFERGSVTIQDRTPNDAFDPKIWGDTRGFNVSDAGEKYTGTDVRFRLIGGEFRLVVQGSGIDLSAVGDGRVHLDGAGRSPGTYSLDGADCSGPRAKCKELPSDPGRWLALGDGPERGSSPSRQP